MVLLTVDPRTIDEADFPGTGTSEEQWLFLLNYALMAPSEYNTQPWCFHVQGNVLELSADRSRRLPIVDPDDREMLISCGAACLNLRLAASHFGYQTWVENFMLDQQPDMGRELYARPAARHTCAPGIKRKAIASERGGADVRRYSPAAYQSIPL